MEKGPARPRQPDARAMPLEDRTSQLALDLRDTTADRRRFNPRRQRGSTNVECLGHIDERAEISEFHASARRASLMPKRYIDRPIHCGGCLCRKVMRGTWHDLMSSARQGGSDQIGRAHVLTPVTNAHIVCRL